ncbi:MAG: ADP-glyceromanno-heptose 6-epimerase [Halobacteriovoraceae bacterium]|nr:ADP-glyceromanno-heptose 6-epimerase [Halobacteriovoraceae bacterium]
MILITGGAGFIGSVLARELNKARYNDIIIVDKMGSSSKWKNLPSAKFLDIIHPEELFSLNDKKDELFFKNLDCIFHLGACTSTTEKDMDFLIKNNVYFSQILFSHASEHNVPFIYASSAATYGSGNTGYDDNHQKIDQIRPLNPYGYSKHLFDQWVLREQNPPSHWYGLKFFNVYGPNEYHKEDMCSMVYKSFHQIKKEKKARLFRSHHEDFKNGEQLRDFIYVKDVVLVMMKIMSGLPASGIYNLGSGKARSFNDLIRAVFKSLDVPENIEYIDTPENIRSQYQYFTQAKMTKLNEALPDLNIGTMEDGVTDYLKNYLLKDNPYY